MFGSVAAPAPPAVTRLDLETSDIEQVTTPTTAWTGGRVRFVGLLALLLGIGVLAQAYMVPPNSTLAYGLFWLGLGTCFGAAVLVGLSPGARPGHQLLALAGLGAAMYVPTFLRSPRYPIFQDELFHVQSLQLMHDLGTTHIPVTNFNIPGDYPGMELVGLVVEASTGLSYTAVIRILPLAFHTLIPVMAYLALRACGLSPALTFFGALVYLSNWGYYWFHSTFSYESLGIVFFLLVALLAMRLVDDRRRDAVATVGLLLIGVGATVVTHHVSGLMSALVLVLLTTSVTLVRRRKSPLFDVAGFAIVVWLGWLLFQTNGTLDYLLGNFQDRVTNIMALMRGEHGQARELYWNTPVPLPEQIITYLYPLIVFGLICTGLYRQASELWNGWRTNRRLAISPARLALLVFGPLVWLATAPMVLTRSADVVYRSWAFIFVGVALYSAIGFSRWLDRPTSGLAAATPYLAVGLLLAGALILSDNHAGRFRTTELHSSDGPEAITDDLVSSARWLEANSGRFHGVVGDAFSSVAFAVFGLQRTDLWFTWLSFYTDDPVYAQTQIDRVGGEFVVVDLRDARYLPRYNYYFNYAEFFEPQLASSLGKTIPLQDLTKFDKMPRLRRVYDNGDIVVYQSVNTSTLAPSGASN